MAGTKSGAIVLRGGAVVDGTGAPARRADVLIRGDMIVAVEPPGMIGGGSTEVNCRGKHVLPGFIDAHSHADYTIPLRPDAPALVQQGVTTTITGNCGFSPFPSRPTDERPLTGSFLNPALDRSWRDLRAFADHLGSLGLAVNVAPLAGHSAIRATVVGPEAGPADSAEVEQIRGLTADVLRHGAIGISLGLAYPAARDAQLDELRAVAAEVALAGAVLSVHVRDERACCVESVTEALTLAVDAGVALQISHLKVMGRANWDSMGGVMNAINASIERGADVQFDMYPYAAGCTTLSSALPRWADRGGSEAIRSLLASPEARCQIRDELAGGQGYIDLGEVVVSAVSPRWQHLRGRSLVTAAAAEGVQPADLLLDILADEGDEATMIVEAMASADVDRVLGHPAAMVGSDGWVLTPDRSAHPRNFATFVRTLQQAAIGEAELAGAVRRQTSAVARRFALEGRGRVTPGCFADLVVVDVAELDEGGGFDDPTRSPRGIERVYVNGAATFDPNGMVSRPGRVLLNPRPRTGGTHESI